MNQTELLDQFVIEARECLEAIGQRLLDVERRPDDASLLNDLFRSVHTLKGNCGLFEFKPLERVVHAGEDLLDHVRNGAMAYNDEIADALLAAMDYSAELIDHIERHGRIGNEADGRSTELATALRVLLKDHLASAAGESGAVVPTASVPHAAHATTAASAMSEPPAWLARLADAASHAAEGAIAMRYTPEPECFFKGEDPWRLACTAPGLVGLHVDGQSPWPTAGARDEWDCYQCNLDIVLLSQATRAELDAHFRCVPEQVQWHVLIAQPAADEAAAAAAATSPVDALLHNHVAKIWAEQCALLERGTTGEGTCEATRRVLAGLLRAGQADDQSTDAPPFAGDLPLDRHTLLEWARRHAPQRDGAADANASGACAITPEAPGQQTGLGALPGRSTDANALDASRRGDEPGGDRQSRVLKVGQEKIDRLMDLIGEMVVAKNSLPYLAQRAETVFAQRELAREIKAQYAVINRIAEDMQHAIMQVRMLPVGTIFQRFGRLVRDISKKLGKEVHLVIEGEETEADKNVIESLGDPLIHILRNSLDHGIELPAQRLKAGKPAHGTIRILARQESDRVLIDIADDGAGVNPQRVRDKAIERGLVPADRAATLTDDEAVQLVFLPGFSTADSISDLSGRGVGMDVVRTAVERIGGSVELSSRAGQGTTLRLSLPLSMAVTNVMIIESGGRRFGVPMDLIVETVRVHAEDIHHFKQARTTVLRGRIVPLRSLNELLAMDGEDAVNDDGEHAVLVVRMGNENVGLLIDQFHGASDIILKPLEGILAGLTGFAGTALMGDGGVLMVLNPKELF